MTSIELVLAAHNHQPVGNFDHVIEDAYQRAYRPFLEVLERHPGVPFVLHQPGFLWDWIEAHHPEYLERVGRMVERGQLELLSGGYYEPILPVIPAGDRRGQIEKLQERLERRFGVRPRGAWLAERVWEPHLVETLHAAGIEYTVLDDSHFLSAGIPASELDGAYVTEENGHTLRVFPISQQLRYAIPFAPPEETIEFLRQRAAPSAGAAPVWTLADDGEKFGIWPSTHALCYGERWLDRFFEALVDNASWLHTTTFSASLDRTPPCRRTYLPSASYAEMMQWALPAPAQRTLQRALASADGDPELRAFVRGGFWRNFLSRYPESNWMHKRMLYVSHGVATLRDAGAAGTELDQAEDALWRSQCNCAYWHGLFGGLYLPHLRSAIYANLIRAERSLAHLRPMEAVEVFDFDADGATEILLRSRSLAAFVKPDAGGAVYELDALRHDFNLLDLMTRREEAYHDTLRQMEAVHADAPDSGPAAGAHETGDVKSIHERVAVKEPGLGQRLVYDPYRRGACIDHVLAPEVAIESFLAARLPDVAGLATRPYAWHLDGETLHLECEVPLQLPGSPRLHVHKQITLRDGVLEVRHSCTASETIEIAFGVEMGVNFQAGDAPDRYFEVPGRSLEDRRLGSAGGIAATHRFDVVDAWRGVRARFESETPVDVWRLPLETVSSSESGFERVYQGSALLFVSRHVLESGTPMTRVLGLRIEAHS